MIQLSVRQEVEMGCLRLTYWYKVEIPSYRDDLTTASQETFEEGMNQKRLWVEDVLEQLNASKPVEEIVITKLEIRMSPPLKVEVKQTLTLPASAINYR